MICAYADISTCHVTPHDMELAQAGVGPVTAVYPEGAFFYVAADDVGDGALPADKDVDDALRELGYSESFVKAMDYARKHDCWLLRLDADGDDGLEAEALDVHEWTEPVDVNVTITLADGSPIELAGFLLSPTEPTIMFGEVDEEGRRQRLAPPAHIEWTDVPDQVDDYAVKRQRVEAAVLMALDDRQHAAVLAGLRCYQKLMERRAPSEAMLSLFPPDWFEAIRLIATNGDTLAELEDEDIDALCERLNCSPKPTMADLQKIWDAQVDRHTDADGMVDIEGFNAESAKNAEGRGEKP